VSRRIDVADVLRVRAWALPVLSMILIIFLGASGCTTHKVIKGKVLAKSRVLSSIGNGPVNDGNEPPENPYLADSYWPMTHRNPYCQASSPFHGPLGQGPASFDFRRGFRAVGGLITIAFSPLYPDGRMVIWGSAVNCIFKAYPTVDGMSIIDLVKKKHAHRFSIKEGISGAYTIVDKDNTFFVPRLKKIYAYADSIKGNPESKIAQKGVFTIPGNQLRGKDDFVVGLNMTYDGMLAFATSHGTVGVVSRSFDRAFYYHCPAGEEISNSIACDEDGGIYVVTSKHMYRVQWTGDRLSTDEKDKGWIADYDTGGNIEGIRLGQGSGSTPTLMGTGSQDRFVVITDGQRLMHLVLFWRDSIPDDWVQIPGTKDRRIAAQVPVTFGNPRASQSSSEQSVCVRGYGALVVNNQLKTKSKNRIMNILRSGNPGIAPYGAEKFEWNPRTRKLRSVWANNKVSLPNGIPCMSAATNLVYDVGQRDGVWTWEAIDWSTGETVFYYELGGHFWYNSGWAGTEIGPNKSLFSGTVLGMMRLVPLHK